jgi:hypothetical protein
MKTRNLPFALTCRTPHMRTCPSWCSTIDDPSTLRSFRLSEVVDGVDAVDGSGLRQLSADLMDLLLRRYPAPACKLVQSRHRPAARR